MVRIGLEGDNGSLAPTHPQYLGQGEGEQWSLLRWSAQEENNLEGSAHKV